jgi:hypothetical protein
MRTLIIRRQRLALFGGAVILCLDLRAEFSPAELAHIRRHRLQRMLLYERKTLLDPGRGLIGMGFRLWHQLSNLTIRVSDLFEGCRIESRDFVEMAAIEAELRRAFGMFGEILQAADGFVGEQVLET